MLKNKSRKKHQVYGRISNRISISIQCNIIIYVSVKSSYAGNIEIFKCVFLRFIKDYQHFDKPRQKNDKFKRSISKYLFNTIIHHYTLQSEDILQSVTNNILALYCHYSIMSQTKTLQFVNIKLQNVYQHYLWLRSKTDKTLGIRFLMLEKIKNVC